MPTSKSCATVTAIHKTSHSTTHEYFRAYRFSCADAESTSPQCLPAHAASARKKHSPPDTAASPTTYTPNSTSTPPTPKTNTTGQRGSPRFVGGRSAIDGCSYLGRPPDKIRWCSFPQPAMVLGRITEQWRASRRYRFGASPECLGIGVSPLFPHQQRSAARHAHDVKHRRTGQARNTLSRIVFPMMMDNLYYPRISERASNSFAVGPSPRATPRCSAATLSHIKLTNRARYWLVLQLLSQSYSSPMVLVWLPSQVVPLRVNHANAVGCGGRVQGAPLPTGTHRHAG